MKILMLAVGFWLSVFGLASAQKYDYEGAKAHLTNEVAGKFYDPGPTFVSKVLAEARYYNDPDLGMNMTSLTTYGIGEILFGEDYQGIKAYDDTGEYLAQRVIIKSIRSYLANPTNLTGLWEQVKSMAIPVVLNRVGQTRINTWLSPAFPLMVKGGFNPAFGKNYEDWRTNGCQWYLQISPDSGYTPKMSEEDCSRHIFVRNLRHDATADAAFVNMAHWYGFLWRRYLEGDMGLVAAWQSIMYDVAKAVRSS
jgi:hypothetical protein